MYKNRLKEIRMNLNIKQSEVADYLQISTSSYGTYENEIDIMPIKHLNTLSNYFNVSIDYLFSFTHIKSYSIFNKEIDEIKSGLRLKEIRQSNKLTQIKLSEMLNTDNSTISKYEKGINTIATPFLYDICKKYNISADYLLGKIDNPKYLEF